MLLSVTVSLCCITADRTALAGVLRVCYKDFRLRQRSFVFQHLPELVKRPGDYYVSGFETDVLRDSTNPG